MFREDFQVWNELGGKIQTPRLPVCAQDTDAERSRVGFAGEGFGPPQKVGPDSAPSVRRQHDEIADQSVGARRTVELGERLSRENGHEANHGAVVLRYEHVARCLDPAGCAIGQQDASAS